MGNNGAGTAKPALRSKTAKITNRGVKAPAGRPAAKKSTSRGGKPSAAKKRNTATRKSH